ncbi:hypothetical protein Tco_1144097 [Tanacetum coccineum]
MSDGESVMSEQDTSDNTDAPNLEPHDEGMSSDDDVDEWLITEMEEHKKGDNEEDALIDILKSLVEECKAVYKEDDRPSKELPCQLPPKELSLGIFALPYIIGSFNLYAMADLGTCVNIIPNLVFEYLKLTNLRKTDMLVKMANWTQQAPLGTVENDLETSKGRTDHLPNNEHVCKPVRVFYNDDSGEDCRIWPTCNLDLSFYSGYEAVYGKGEHGMLKQWDKVFNEWVLDSFDVKDDYATKIGKKGYVLDDVREKCKQNYGGTTYAWHDEGYEEEELWKSGIEKTKYEPPMVNVETFDVKRYSFMEGRSFICITKQFDDALPLGRANWSQFARMIKDELGAGGSAQGAA